MIRLYLHGGGFPRPVVTQEGRDVVLVEVHTEPVHRQLLARLVDLHKVLNGDPGFHIRRWLLKVTFGEQGNARKRLSHPEYPLQEKG